MTASPAAAPPAAVQRRGPRRAALKPPSLPLRAGLWVASRSLRTMGGFRYVLADTLGLALYAAQPDRARQCAANHRRLERGIDGVEARRRARGSFREFMRTSFDFVWAYAVPPERMDRYFISAGTGPVYDALDRLGGAVFALAHYGSWDVAAACALRLQIPITTVMTTVGESDLATRVAGWARRQQDMEVLMTRGAAIGLLRAVRSGRCDAILCDIPDRGQRTTVNFCGGMVAFSTAPAWIARTAGVPLLPVHCWREDGGYILKVYAPVRVGGEVSDAEAMQAVADVLAIQVRRMPEQWYPFGEVFKD